MKREGPPPPTNFPGNMRKYEEICEEYEDIRGKHEEICGKYEETYGEYEEICK